MVFRLVEDLVLVCDVYAPIAAAIGGIRRRSQPGDPDKVVGDQIEQEVGGDASRASMFGLAHGSVLLAPAEDTFGHGTA